MSGSGSLPKRRRRAKACTAIVRNLADGRVEALVEGDQEAVDRVEMALRRGPSGARIDAFEVEPAAPAYRATGFSVR